MTWMWTAISSNWIQRCIGTCVCWPLFDGASWRTPSFCHPLIITKLSIHLWVMTKFFSVFAWFYVKIYSSDFELQEKKAQLSAGPADIWAFHLAILWLLFPYVRNYFSWSSFLSSNFFASDPMTQLSSRIIVSPH